MFRRGRQKPKRRWWQRLIRIAALVAILLIGLYVTMPFWMPTNLLKRHLAKRMSRQMGVEVRIEGMSLSWSRGVEIRNLQIDSPPAFGSKPMVDVKEIRIELAPIDFLLRGRIGWMELEEPRASVRIDPAGNVNLGVLEKLQFDAQPLRVSVRQAVGTIRLPDHDRLLQIRVSDAEYVAGRIESLGRVSVSAAVDQEGGSAPVSLRLATSSGGQVVAADALFNFSNVDLAQLQLPKLLGLPLRKLSGRCRGSLNLQINRQLEVDRFSVNLTIRNLDVQPRTGPKLPLIDEAGLRLAAAYDPLTGHLDIQSASVRLPGIDLAGRASLFSEIRRGQWQAIKKLDLEGMIYPSRLAALLTGRRELPGKLEMDGPVALEFSAALQNELFNIQAKLRATSAVIRQADREIKPAGQTLELDLVAQLDRRNWQLQVDKDKTRLSFGQNTFKGGGAVRDVRRLVALLRGRNGQTVSQVAMQVLALLDLEGMWEVRELKSLCQLAGPASARLEAATLEGPIIGKCSVKQFAGTQMHLSVLIPPETQLIVEDFFVKKATGAKGAMGRDKPLNLDFSGKIDQTELSVRRLTLDLVAGDGRLSIDNHTMTFPAVQSGGFALEAKGGINAQKIEAILAHSPALARLLGGRVKGGLEGQYDIELAGKMHHGRVEVNLRDMDLRSGRWFYKPPGREARLVADYAYNKDAPPKERRLITLEAQFPEAKFQAGAILPEELSQDKTAKMWVDAKIKDAGWLADMLPALGQNVERLSGPVELNATANRDAQGLAVEVRCNADGLGFASAEEVRRLKRAGVPLRIHLTASLSQRQSGGRIAKVRELEVQFADSQLRLSGEFPPDHWSNGMKMRPSSLASMKGFRGEAELALSIDDSLLELVPELAEPVHRHGLDGSLVGRLKIRGDGKMISVVSHLDAGAFSAAHVGPFVSTAPTREDSTDLIEIGPFVKPKGLPAEADLELTVPADLSRLQVNNLHVRLGGLVFLAGARIDLDQTAEGWPRGLGQMEAHASVSIKRLENLASLAPFVQPYRLSGDFFLDCQLRNGGSEGLEISSVKFHASRLAANYRGKDVTIAGEISVGDVQFSQNSKPSIGWLKTGGLELKVGENHCWLIAELAGLPEQASGEFDLLATYLDDKDLKDWLSRPANDSAQHDQSPPKTQPAPASQPSFRLTDNETEQLREKAEQLIADMQAYLLTAKVNGRISIDRFRTFDASVNQAYEVRHVEMEASVDEGRVKLAYAAGLNGGTIRSSSEIRLADEAPTVVYETSIREIIASENFQPQLARYFPGNTFSGLFHRTERATVPLRNVLANVLDYRYPLHPTGTAKAIATDGLLEGRAAPKFIAGIFPGLNLAKYRYKKMTSFATFLPDGVAENDMVFSGRTYDIYIEGTTDAQNIGRYNVGLTLLGTPQSAEWNHLYRQGRILIFKLKARIEGGKMHDEVIRYPWPNETLGEILLKNNIIYRVWLTARKKRAAAG